MVRRFTFPLNARTGLGVAEEIGLISPFGPHTKPYPPKDCVSNKGDNFLNLYTQLLSLNVFQLVWKRETIDPFLLNPAAWQTEAH